MNKNVLKTTLFVCFFSLFSCFYLFATTYYLPHIHTGSDAWETYLILDNTESRSIKATGYFYDSNGSLVLKKEYNISAQETKKIPLREIGAIAGKVICSVGSLRVRLSYIARDDLGGGTAEFSPDTKLSKYLILTLSNYYDKLTWSGFALWNTLNKSVLVDLYAYGKNRDVFVHKTIEMQPHQKIVDYFDNFFEVESFKDIDFVRVVTSIPALSGVVISGKENDKLLFTKPKNEPDCWGHEEYWYYQDCEFSNIVQTEDYKFHVLIRIERLNTIFHVTFDKNVVSDSFFANPIEDFTLDYLGDMVAIGNDVFISGVRGTSFIVAKLSSQNTIEWEKTVGQAPSSSFNPMDYKIICAGIDNSILACFMDRETNSGKTVILDTGGNIIDSIDGVTETAEYGAAQVFTDTSNNKLLAYSFAYFENKLQVVLLNTDGSLAKKIYGPSPLPDSDGVHHQILGMFIGNEDHIYLVVGKETPVVGGWRQLHLYLVTISKSDHDFSNAVVTDLNAFAPFCSKAIVFNTKNINGHPTLQVIVTPYNGRSKEEGCRNSDMYLVWLDSNNIPYDYSFFKQSYPYKVYGAIKGWYCYYVAATQRQYLWYPGMRTKLILKQISFSNSLQY